MCSRNVARCSVQSPCSADPWRCSRTASSGPVGCKKRSGRRLCLHTLQLAATNVQRDGRAGKEAERWLCRDRCHANDRTTRRLAPRRRLCVALPALFDCQRRRYRSRLSGEGDDAGSEEKCTSNASPFLPCCTGAMCDAIGDGPRRAVRACGRDQRSGRSGLRCSFPLSISLLAGLLSSSTLSATSSPL